MLLLRHQSTKMVDRKSYRLLLEGSVASYLLVGSHKPSKTELSFIGHIDFPQSVHRVFQITIH